MVHGLRWTHNKEAAGRRKRRLASIPAMATAINITSKGGWGKQAGTWNWIYRQTDFHKDCSRRELRAVITILSCWTIKPWVSSMIWHVLKSMLNTKHLAELLHLPLTVRLPFWCTCLTRWFFLQLSDLSSSWRPFGPLNFVFHALRALRPCDKRVSDWIALLASG